MAIRVDFNTGTTAVPVFSDITSYVRSVSISRGKDELLDGFSAGTANIELDNRDRRFDPLYTSSPYNGDIVPRREVRVFADYDTATTAVRTNLVLNPSFEYATGGSVVAWSTSTGGSVVTGGLPLYGTVAVLVNDDASESGLVQTFAAATAGSAYVASAYAEQLFSLTDFTLIRMRLAWLDDSLNQIGDEIVQNLVPTSGWQRFSIGAVCPTNATQVRLRFGGDRQSPSSALVYGLDGVQFEIGSATGSYIDGDQTDDPPTAVYAWTGTAGNSPSTLTYLVEKGLAFYGYIDDWDLNYEIGGNNTASIKASDGFGLLANQVIANQTMPIELSGLRILRMLFDPNINYPGPARNIQAGVKFLGTDVTSNDNALLYLQQIELSELGQLFVDKTGDLTFLDSSQNNPQPGDSTQTFADDGTGIAFTTLDVVYGSEQLTNTLAVTYPAGLVVGTNTTSVSAYGVTSLSVETVNQNSTDAEYLANYYTLRFGSPQYRVNAITVNLLSLSEANQTAVLGLELGDVVTVKFTPGNVAPQILQYAKIVRINSNISDGGKRYEVEFGLETFQTFPFILNDATYGKLDSTYVLGF